MKIAFLVNRQTPDIEVVGKILKEFSYTVINSSAADEVDQAGLQAGKVILVFDDAKFAYKFCGENPTRGDYQTLRILFLGRKPIMSPDVLQKLGSVGLRLYSYGQEEVIRESINKFEQIQSGILELTDEDFDIVGALAKVPPLTFDTPIENTKIVKKDKHK